ncbi:MAG TPA: hypothetical protein VHM19_00805 [Polyangiales bacterium]|nr:hypothetical protein [Polyangiales bacterium]
MPTSFAAVRKPLSALLRAQGLIPATWSLDTIRARVMGLRREASDTVSLLLHPNIHWRGFLAGQHVRLSIEIDHERHTRAFAITSSPRAGIPLRVTVRRRPNDPVSQWVCDRARRNDIVVLGPAEGSFVLPDNLPGDVLFITGGSGIAPVISMVRDLLYSGHRDQITCMSYARHELLFQDELNTLSQEFVNLNVVPYLTGVRITDQPKPRVTLDEIATVHPSWQQSEAFVSGPPSLVSAVTEIWTTHGVSHRLHAAQSTASTALGT